MALNWDQYLEEIKSEEKEKDAEKVHEYLKKHWKIDECVITPYCDFPTGFFKQNQKTEKHCVNQLVTPYVCSRFQHENVSSINILKSNDLIDRW